MLAAGDEQNAVLRRRPVELEGLVATLRAQLGRESSNSSRPPSSDSPFVKKPAAIHEKAGVLDALYRSVVSWLVSNRCAWQ